MAKLLSNRFLFSYCKATGATSLVLSYGTENRNGVWHTITVSTYTTPLEGCLDEMSVVDFLNCRNNDDIEITDIKKVSYENIEQMRTIDKVIVKFRYKHTKPLNETLLDCPDFNSVDEFNLWKELNAN